MTTPDISLSSDEDPDDDEVAEKRKRNGGRGSQRCGPVTRAAPKAKVTKTVMAIALVLRMMKINTMITRSRTNSFNNKKFIFMLRSEHFVITESLQVVKQCLYRCVTISRPIIYRIYRI